MTTDLPIPPIAAIVARAEECRASAVRLADSAAVRQLDRLIDSVPHARLCWQLGALHIVSPSGGQYQVTRAGCSCPNGTKCSKRQCYHIALFELLVDMFDTDAESADIAAEARPVTPRIVAARSVVWATL